MTTERNTHMFFMSFKVSPEYIHTVLNTATGAGWTNEGFAPYTTEEGTVTLYLLVLSAPAESSVDRGEFDAVSALFEPGKFEPMDSTEK